ncbi:argininosuccinate lyase [Methanolacinia petrolearia DSM 11571]|uniref:Argininosuccinate lyase n=1 Tax=Methanolacinia petrolearia (strain DSM 11571 / OCM 486 / SEBR 4847) TaxID=679926 RepID=E1RD51_METP4|nr:argininosuccinate lyase [Methanolacinia petrolearia]ADN37034.1 argininosuccinate lyase [Methanolacinia petrolearia DSM 11571]
MSKDPLREGRLGDGRPPEVWSYLSSREADRFIGDADILVDIAHLLMLEKQNIIGREAAEKIMTVLLDLHENGLPDSVFNEKFEDVHAGIEALVIEKTGIDTGGRLHMGRSRNDEVATCARVRLKTGMAEIMAGINKVRDVLIEKAGQNTESYMPGFTHLQHAQPTTLAHYMMNYEQVFTRDFERFGDAYLRLDLCPLGAAAFASTGYPIDREYTAELLGFSGVLENSMDCVAGRDVFIEVISACSILMTTLSRMCEELILWSSSFVNFIELADEYCSTSSIMPQKKNPDCAEIMRGKAGSVLGALTASMTIVKGLPMSYNRDLQDLWPHLWRSVEDVKASLAIIAGMIDTATFNTERMNEEAGKGFSTATELADVMVREFGLPFRTAHGITGRAVRMKKIDIDTLEEAAVEMAGISLKKLGMTEEDVKRALGVAYSVNERSATGGPAPEAVMASIAGKTAALKEDAEWLADIKIQNEEANKRMIEAAEELRG